jgi:hypothetical protein
MFVNIDADKSATGIESHLQNNALKVGTVCGLDRWLVG